MIMIQWKNGILGPIFLEPLEYEFGGWESLIGKRVWFDYIYIIALIWMMIIIDDPLTGSKVCKHM